MPPLHGWIVSKSDDVTEAANSNVYLNGVKIAFSSSSAQAPIQMLIKKNDTISVDTPYQLTFFPCMSEQYDTRINHTDYDIWKGAILEENGHLIVKNLSCPDASSWYTLEGVETVRSNVDHVENNIAYDINNNFLFNIQTENIENANNLFEDCTNIVSFSGNLKKLVSASRMFWGCNALSNFNSDLSNCTNGDGMFMGCKLNKESVINIINCLKNSNTCSVAATLTLGIDASLNTDTEIQTLLGITEEATSATLVGHGGGTWTITIEWNEN